MNRKSVKNVVRPLHKAHPVPRLVYDRNENDLSEKETALILQDIQKKVNDSYALNSKVDVLLLKVENIEEEQVKISKTVESIHDAIYHPDNGIFSRISAVRSAHAEEKAELEKHLLEINSWKTQTEKSVAQNKSDDKEIQKKVEEQQLTLSNLEKWRGNVQSVGKWALVAIGGGIVTMLFKALSDLMGIGG